MPLAAEVLYMIETEKVRLCTKHPDIRPNRLGVEFRETLSDKP